MTEAPKPAEMPDLPKCAICGEPMPQGEEMFKFHGYSGPCPKPPMKKEEEWNRLDKIKADVSILKNAYQNFADQYEQDRFDRIVSCAEYLNTRASETAGKADLEGYKAGNWFMAHSVEEMQAFYMSRLPAIREAAKECGYAIGLHGSTKRDLDLIAIPWRENVFTKDELANAIMDAACGFRQPSFQWEEKPSGRVACSIPICWAQWDGCYDVKSLGHIDLSVMTVAASTSRLNATVGDGWRPIESCPKIHGKRFLGYHFEIGHFVAEWFVDSFVYTWNQHVCPITHWMPLPAAPSSEGG